MMMEEFESRFGMEVSPAVYERIEELYMQGDEDKDAFVRRVKKQNLVVKIQSELIEEMDKRIRDTERYLKRAKAEADERHHRYGDLDGEKRKDYEAARDLLVEGSRDYFAYNNYLMSLTESVTCSYALETLTGKEQ